VEVAARDASPADVDLLVELYRELYGVEGC